jgi:hypothetical protein
MQNNMKTIFILNIILTATISVFCQQVKVPESIIIESQKNSKKDSIELANLIDKLKLDQTREEIESSCHAIDKIKYNKWISFYSETIIRSCSKFYKKSSPCVELMCLVKVPLSIKDSILQIKYGLILAKARLGDSAAIQYYINLYQSERDTQDISYRSWGLTYLIEKLLSIDNNRILQMLFKDMESGRIIVKTESTSWEGGPYDSVYYTLPYAIIMALREKHRGEPIFNEHFMFKYLSSETPDKVNPKIKDYLNLVETFVWENYKTKIKIVTPYLISGWPRYGYFQQ